MPQRRSRAVTPLVVACGPTSAHGANLNAPVCNILNSHGNHRNLYSTTSHVVSISSGAGRCGGSAGVSRGLASAYGHTQPLREVGQGSPDARRRVVPDGAVLGNCTRQYRPQRNSSTSFRDVAVCHGQNVDSVLHLPSFLYREPAMVCEQHNEGSDTFTPFGGCSGVPTHSVASGNMGAAGGGTVCASSGVVSPLHGSVLPHSTRNSPGVVGQGATPVQVAAGTNADGCYHQSRSVRPRRMRKSLLQSQRNVTVSTRHYNRNSNITQRHVDPRVLSSTMRDCAPGSHTVATHMTFDGFGVVRAASLQHTQQVLSGGAATMHSGSGVERAGDHGLPQREDGYCDLMERIVRAAGGQYGQNHQYFEHQTNNQRSYSQQQHQWYPRQHFRGRPPSDQRRSAYPRARGHPGPTSFFDYQVGVPRHDMRFDPGLSYPSLENSFHSQLAGLQPFQEVVVEVPPPVVETRMRPARIRIRSAQDDPAVLDVYMFEAAVAPDVDNMSYEELLELAERIGPVERGVAPERLEQLQIVVQSSHLDPKHDTQIRRQEPDGQVLGSCSVMCCICLDGFEVGLTVLRLPCCKNLLHVTCSSRWFESHFRCPICTRDVRGDD
ncbi:hypothetical protein TRVL_04578 [Trypanosoma vivax]|nr:hypothetical protein TRVL_04578 [Trypanosoma vivax]